MEATPACKASSLPSLNDEDALLAWVRQGLSGRAGVASERDERRLVQLLMRLRPALQEALAAGASADPDRFDAAASAAAFETALMQCSDD